MEHVGRLQHRKIRYIFTFCSHFELFQGQKKWDGYFIAMSLERVYQNEKGNMTELKSVEANTMKIDDLKAEHKFKEPFQGNLLESKQSRHQAVSLYLQCEP